MQLTHNAIKIVLGMTEGQQRATLRKYLLGQLSESESSRLTDRYFIDEKLFDDLLDVENELLDEYVTGRLPIEEQKQFRDYLICLPDGSTKLATAYALKEARHEIRHTVPAEADRTLPVSTPLSRLRSFRAALSEPRRLLQFVSAAIVIALLCGLAYLIISQRALRRQVEQLRAARTQAEHERTIAAQQAGIAQANEATLRDRNLQLERELTQLQEQINQQNDNPDSPAIALHLFSPALRSPSAPDSITISNATKFVLLVMPIPKDEQITNYSAILRTTGGQLLWSNERVRPHKSQQGRSVSLRLPTARLTHSAYKLTLLGKAADGVEIAHDFYFNIIRK